MSEQAPGIAAASLSQKAQRIRLRFARGQQAASIGHLDLARRWERALREAGVSVSYSQSNRPQPRLTLAAGLPMGVTSEGELLDVVLAERLPPGDIIARVRAHLPDGLEALEAWEVGLGLPALPSAVRWADYEVDVPIGEGLPDVAAVVASFLAAEQLPWEDTRGEKTRHYDLRALVQEVRVEGRCDGVVRLSMRLRCDTARVGRADQVVLALGLPPPARVHRRRLVLSEVSPARDAWRRRGRYAG